MSEEIANHSEPVTQTIETQEVVTAPTESVTTQIAEPTGIPIKFNGEEKVVSLEEAPNLIQKGMNYDKAIERAKQESRDAYIAEQGFTWNGKPITTEAEHKQAMREVEIRKEYEDQDLPEDILNEIVEGKKFRAEAEPQLAQIRTEKKQTADFKALFEAYPDLDANTVPATVWVDYNNGKDLVDSYARHENASLKQRLAEIEQKQQIEQLNQANANSSTGSLTGNGSAAPSFFTLEQVQKMSQSEVDKNYKAIMESQKKWY